MNANRPTSRWTASRMDGAQFSSYLAALGETFNSESYWVSIPLRHLLLRAPVEVARSCIKQWKFAFEPSPIQTREPHNDMFPLPLMLSDEDLRWDMAAADPSASRGAPTRAAQRAWSQCVVLVLNTWAAAPQSTNRNPDDYRCFEASATKNPCLLKRPHLPVSISLPTSPCAWGRSARRNCVVGQSSLLTAWSSTLAWSPRGPVMSAVSKLFLPCRQ